MGVPTAVPGAYQRRTGRRVAMRRSINSKGTKEGHVHRGSRTEGVPAVPVPKSTSPESKAESKLGFGL